MPAVLDREGCRIDPTLIGQWKRSVDAEYRALLEGVDVLPISVGRGAGTGDRSDATKRVGPVPATSRPSGGAAGAP
jgi:hypothetical protein